MSNKPTQVGLSANEVSELMQLRNSYQSKIGYDLSDSAAALGVSLAVATWAHVVVSGAKPLFPPLRCSPFPPRRTRVGLRVLGHSQGIC
jgi:hypothetical protein